MKTPEELSAETERLIDLRHSLRDMEMQLRKDYTERATFDLGVRGIHPGMTVMVRVGRGEVRGHLASVWGTTTGPTLALMKIKKDGTPSVMRLTYATITPDMVSLPPEAPQ